MCLFFFRYYLLLACLTLCISSIGWADTLINVRTYASKRMIDACDSLKEVRSKTFHDVDLAHTADLAVKDHEDLIVNGDSVCALIVGCTGFGELIVLDSCAGSQIQKSIEFTIPGMHVHIESTQDINNDGYDEIILSLSGGAHGLYRYFLSVYDDSLSFIESPQGGYGFFALSGGVHLKDFDGDDVYEIVVDGVLKEGQSANYTIYKWDKNNKCYNLHKEVIKQIKK